MGRSRTSRRSRRRSAVKKEMQWFGRRRRCRAFGKRPPSCQRLEMRSLARPVLVLTVALTLAARPAGSTADDLRGFTPQSASIERDWETKFRALPSPDSLRSYMRRLSARPHHVGSPYDRDNAEWILGKF